MTKQEVLNYLDNVLHPIVSPDNWNVYSKLYDMIEELPSAEPMRHAKNIGTDYDEVDQFVCSECGIELQGWYRVERDEDDGEETHHEYRLRCCPQCGARVDEK